MSSQAHTKQESPASSDHSNLIPCDREYALLDETGLVVAMVRWVSTDGPIEERIYALDEPSLALVPRLSDSEDHVGAWAQDQRAFGWLVNYYRDVALSHPGVLRIDDDRPGHLYSYRIYDGPPLEGEGRLAAGRPYYLFVDSDEHTEPRLEAASDILSLADRPEAVVIRDVGGLTYKKVDDPEVVELLGDLSGIIRVWDECAIQRNLMS